MTEATQTGAAPAAAPPTAISTTQAATMLAERRAQSANGGANPVSDAARALGQRSAQARQERQAQAATQPQESPEGEGGDVKDDSTQTSGEGETLNETANGESPDETQTEGQGEPQEAETIDLGDGVKVTLDEVRDGFMLKADHTRKTQALAEKEKHVEAVRTQKLAQLDKIVSALEQKIGKPKTLSQLIQEYGKDEALEKFAEQTDELERLEAARGIAERQQRDFMSSTLSKRDQALAETYNKEWSDPDKRDAAYTELTGYALKLGATAEELKFLPSPWMIQVLDKAKRLDALEANKGNVTKHIADKPKVTRPGAKVSAQAGAFSATQAAKAKLKSSGSLADAVALLRTQRQAGARTT
jgi:hypothetical protein